jgi:hypothetical protein
MTPGQRCRSSGVAANNRSRVEMKVFAMYVASEHGPAKLRAVAKKYGIFLNSIDSDWWGRAAFVRQN